MAEPESDPAGDQLGGRPGRFGTILEQLAEHGTIRVVDLARRLRVSPMTVRRDLEELERRHLLTRTHGGAVTRSVVYELPLRSRSTAHIEEKRRIAAAAAGLVAEGAVIGLTGGTTTTEVARALIERESLTVVTNALNIAWELAVHRHIKLVLTGGVVRTSSYELGGPLAEETLSRLNLDLVFLGVDGLDVRHGLTTHQEVEAHTNRTMIAHANRVVVAADHSKIGQVRFAQICPLRAAHGLITDRAADPAQVSALRSAGLPVELV
ncbi:MAG: DeoR/GlpR transcriptional regulator [Candidatus Dormibacteraeota bacterium]|nr:DeoR/GlpR transcriptional regulator [Candidatus Dormibacteraeota bacterium]